MTLFLYVFTVRGKIFLDLITSCHIQNQVQFILYLIRAICM